MNTHEVTKEESEIIEKSTRKHLICKHKKSGLLYEWNPLQVNWYEDYQDYYLYDEKLNAWKDCERPITDTGLL